MQSALKPLASTADERAEWCAVTLPMEKLTEINGVYH